METGFPDILQYFTNPKSSETFINISWPNGALRLLNQISEAGAAVRDGRNGKPQLGRPPPDTTFVFYDDSF